MHSADCVPFMLSFEHVMSHAQTVESCRCRSILFKNAKALVQRRGSLL